MMSEKTLPLVAGETMVNVKEPPLRLVSFVWNSAMAVVERAGTVGRVQLVSPAASAQVVELKTICPEGHDN